MQCAVGVDRGRQQQRQTLLPPHGITVVVAQAVFDVLKMLCDGITVSLQGFEESGFVAGQIGLFAFDVGCRHALGERAGAKGNHQRANAGVADINTGTIGAGVDRDVGAFVEPDAPRAELQQLGATAHRAQRQAIEGRGSACRCAAARDDDVSVACGVAFMRCFATRRGHDQRKDRTEHFRGRRKLLPRIVHPWTHAHPLWRKSARAHDLVRTRSERVRSAGSAGRARVGTPDEDRNGPTFPATAGCDWRKTINGR